LVWFGFYSSLPSSCAPVAAIATDENADTCSDIEITAGKVLKDSVLITRNAKFLVSGRG